jgi:hypothetical protein
MFVAPPIPAATRLEGNLARAEQAVAEVREAAAKLGPGAAVTSRVTLHARSEREVNEVAAGWNVKPWWTMSGRLYVAVKGDDVSQMEVAYTHAEPLETGTGAAA